MTFKDTKELREKLGDLCEKGVVLQRTENNPYLKYSFKGTDDLISSKWNVKVYTSGKIVCNDFNILKDILKDNLRKPDPNKKVIQIDDAGIGFPLLGVMVGVSDGESIWTETVDASYFQGELYQRKLYLKEYTKKGITILSKKAKAKPNTHRIEICSGFINTKLKNKLRDSGYDVRIVEIKGLLQDKLEQLFKDHVKDTLGHDLAYDPKEMHPKDIQASFNRVVNWGLKNAPEKLKTGWKTFKGM